MFDETWCALNAKIIHLPWCISLRKQKIQDKLFHDTAIINSEDKLLILFHRVIEIHPQLYFTVRVSVYGDQWFFDF